MLTVSEWRTYPLSEVAEIHDNLRLPVNASERAKRVDGLSADALYPYYGATGQVGWIDGYRMDGRFVLVGEDGAPFLDPFARKAFVVEGRTWVNNHAHILRGKAGVLDDRFLMHALNATDYRDHVNGTTRLKLTQQALRRIPIRAPSLETQRRVGARIDELFVAIDDGLDELRRARLELETYRMAILKAAVTGELTADWRATNSTTETGDELLDRIQQDRRQQRRSDSRSGAKRDREPLGPRSKIEKLPPDWVTASVNQLAVKTDYGTSVKCSADERGPLVLRMGDIQDGRVRVGTRKFAPVGASVPLLTRGDVLFNRTNSPELVGKSAVFDRDETWSFASYLVRLRFSGLEPQFFVYWMNSAFGRDWIERNRSQQVGQANVSAGKLMAMSLPLPPVEEQAVIVTAAEERLVAMEEALLSLEALESAGNQLRQSILNTAFRGELIQ